MLKITNWKVYDLVESVIASRNAMRTEPVEYTEEEFNESLKRAIKLVKTSANDSHVKCHDNFLTGIRVSFDIKYPQYWTPEFQRYHFADIVTSSSKMHRLLKMDIDKACNEYVTEETKNNLKSYIEEYNNLINKQDSTQEQIYDSWMKVLANTPLGLELFMRISTNYKQLQTIYWQRKNHKLHEWKIFCKWIEELPYAKQLILNEEL